MKKRKKHKKIIILAILVEKRLKLIGFHIIDPAPMGGLLSKFIGTSTKQYGIGNAIITTKTTQISYKKKRKEGNV